MRLLRADIQNFRSIKSVQIDFEPRCRILVGINETGKSNILCALALLDPDRKAKPGDLRDFLPHEDPNEDAFIRFVFALDKNERNACYESAKLRVGLPSFSTPIIEVDHKQLSLAQFFDRRSEGLYRVDIRTNKRQGTGWSLPPNYHILQKLMKPSPECPQNYSLRMLDGTEKPLAQISLVHEDLLNEVPTQYYLQADAKDINYMAIKEISALVEKQLPDCLYWSYSESQILPAQIPLAQFASNPNMCEPLKQMFVLADLNDISAAINQAHSRPNGIRNLLNRVANRATKHMKNVWKECRGISIELAQNGLNIDASVKDHFNLYDFARRSDGFKRFISFLLMVSAKARTKELVGTLYLQDEPDTSLHPSGARYLRDEIIKISETNYVVYSTHCIFMIDRELLHRHLIVEKHDEITVVSEVDESNITDEEVIYNALGYSIFENLKKYNIIFEGWRDKRLCQVALKSVPSEHKTLKARFSNVGFCHARGVKDVTRIDP